jgi:hypothetical protein
MTRWRAWLVLAALAATGTARADGPAAGRLQELAAAWRAGDAAALAAAATRSGRVRLDLPGVAGGSGSYGHGQLEVVLGRVFAAVQTRGLRFDEAPRAAGAGLAFARGAWTWRVRASGEETSESLTLALRLEEREWRIVEIRSSP